MGMFSDSVKKTVDKIELEVDSQIMVVVQDLFNGVVFDTPVGTPPRDSHPGLLINNWFTKVNGYSQATTPIQDTSGSGSYLNIESLLQDKYFFNKDAQISMSNNQDYAYRAESIGWEDIGGRTPPYKMVAMNLDRVSRKTYK